MPPTRQLENDPRFSQHLALANEKFLRSTEGQLNIEMLNAYMPVVDLSSVERTATTGAHASGWRACIEFYKRLSVWVPPPKPEAAPELLIRDIPPPASTSDNLQQ